MYRAQIKLKKERLNSGFTLREMSGRIGIDYSYLCRIENHKIKIGFNNAAKISMFYGRSMEDLFIKV